MEIWVNEYNNGYTTLFYGVAAIPKKEIITDKKGEKKEITVNEPFYSGPLRRSSQAAESDAYKAAREYRG